MRHPSPRRLVVALLLLLTACSSGVDEVTDEPTTDPELTASVSTVFATYRAAIEQGDAEAAISTLDEGSLADMARVVELARDADEDTIRGLPAAEQLLVLTYRLRPELLEADDPYAALVAGRFGGQDRSLGELGPVTAAGDDLALGVVVDGATGTPTPLRWRFRMEEDRWRFDLVEAHRLLSEAISASARRSGVEVHELVAATVVDLSGEQAATVEALYTEPPR